MNRTAPRARRAFLTTRPIRSAHRPAFTLMELIVVLLVLAILAAISVPTFQRVKGNSAVRAAQTTLEAAARNGEAIAASDRDASDEDIAAAVEEEFTDTATLTVSVGSGADADTVTVTQTNGSVTASGSVKFVDGDAVITNATSGAAGGSGSSSTTTVAPTTTTTVALSLSYASTAFSLSQTPQMQSPTVSGGAPSSFSLAGTLPGGVTFDTVTGAFSTGGLTNASDGTLDTGFTIGTGANGAVHEVLVQPDGKIVVAGEFTRFGSSTPVRNRIVRLNVDGSVDTTFSTGTGASSSITHAVLQSDGKIVIAGSFTSFNGTARNRLARLNPDGSVDTGFDPGTGPADTVHGLALQADGKILLVGNFTSVNGTARNRVARLNTDGSVDAAFNPNANLPVLNVKLQTDGRILLAGYFTTIGGESRDRVARLNTDGSVDTGFVADLSTVSLSNGDFVEALAVQDDGRILIGGDIAGGVARLYADGSHDASFALTGTGLDGAPSDILLQYDGKILVYGMMTAYNDVLRRHLMRLNVDGSLDTSYGSDEGGPNDGWVDAVAIQSDGKIIIGGTFRSYNDATGVSTARNRVARLAADTPPTFPATVTVTLTATDGRTVSLPVTLVLS